MNEEATSQEVILNELQRNTLPVEHAQKHLRLEQGANLSALLDTQNFFYFIVEGKIKLSQINFETSKEQTLYLLSRGDMFDVVTLLDGKHHDLMGEVLEAADLIEVPMDNVRYLLDQDPDFKKLFFPYLAQQLRSMENLSIDLSLYDVYQRLVHLLTRFVDNSKEKASLTKIDNLSHEEIASMIGSVRKVVNRNLQKLKDEGIVNISRKHLSIESLKKLRDKFKN